MKRRKLLFFPLASWSSAFVLLRHPKGHGLHVP